MFLNKKILLISPEAWGDNFVSKHHYALYLSKNNDVYFLNPASGSKKIPFGKLPITFEVITPNLTSVSYKNLIPKLNNLTANIRNKVYAKQAKIIQESIDIEEFDIVWSFDPFRFYNQKVWKGKHYIYHCVDIHPTAFCEKLMAKSSSLVLISSEYLKKNLISANDNIHFTGHGADIKSFEAKANKHVNLPGKNSLKAGYVGNFNNKVDYALIEKIAAFNPTVDFIFIGPYERNNLGEEFADAKAKVMELRKLDNVFFIGSIPSSEIIIYLQSVDINMVVYKEDKRNIIINPHKMMGYFYSGNITVSTWIYEYRSAHPDLLKMVHSNDEMPEAIAQVSKNIMDWNVQEKKSFRRKYAENNSYINKLNAIEELLYNN